MISECVIKMINFGKDFAFPKEVVTISLQIAKKFSSAVFAGTFHIHCLPATY